MLLVKGQTLVAVELRQQQLSMSRCVLWSVIVERDNINGVDGSNHIKQMIFFSQRIGSRPSTHDARGELQRPQTTAAAERGRAGGAVYVPQLSLHSVHQLSSRCLK